MIVVVVEYHCILINIIVDQTQPRTSSLVHAKRLFLTKPIVSCTRNDGRQVESFVVVTVFSLLTRHSVAEVLRFHEKTLADNTIFIQYRRASAAVWLLIFNG